MKRTALALTLILALLFSAIAGMRALEVAIANFVPQASIHINVPTNTTYKSHTLILDYTADFFFTKNKTIAYSLDGKEKVMIDINQSVPLIPNDPLEGERINGNLTLPELLDGSHHLEVYAESTISDYAEVYFTIDTDFTTDTVPPKVSVFSPVNQTYNTTDVKLGFAINETTSWIGYSLDGQANVTITSNITLTGLAKGSHNVRVYANDTAGNTGASETVSFSVAKETPEFFPTTLAVAAAVLVDAVGVGLIVYLNKTRKKKVE